MNDKPRSPRITHLSWGRIEAGGRVVQTAYGEIEYGAVQATGEPEAGRGARSDVDSRVAAGLHETSDRVRAAGLDVERAVVRPEGVALVVDVAVGEARVFRP